MHACDEVARRVTPREDAVRASDSPPQPERDRDLDAAHECNACTTCGPEAPIAHRIARGSVERAMPRARRDLDRGRAPFRRYVHAQQHRALPAVSARAARVIGRRTEPGCGLCIARCRGRFVRIRTAARRSRFDGARRDICWLSDRSARHERGVVARRRWSTRYSSRRLRGRWSPRRGARSPSVERVDARPSRERIRPRRRRRRGARRPSCSRVPRERHLDPPAKARDGPARSASGIAVHQRGRREARRPNSRADCALGVARPLAIAAKRRPIP